MGGGLSRLGGASTASRSASGPSGGSLASRRLVDGASRRRRRASSPFFIADLFSPCVESSVRLALWQGFLQDAASALLEVAAQLHNAAHGARMAPRGGLEGPRQARQGCSRYSRHRAGFSSPATRCAGNWSYVPQGGPSGSLSGQPGDRDAWSSSTPSDLVRAPEANYTRLPTLARPLSTDRRPFFGISSRHRRPQPRAPGNFASCLTRRAKPVSSYLQAQKCQTYP